MHSTCTCSSQVKRCCKPCAVHVGSAASSGMTGVLCRTGLQSRTAAKELGQRQHVARAGIKSDCLLTSSESMQACSQVILSRLSAHIVLHQTGHTYIQSSC